MTQEPPKKKRFARWYFGGLASAGGALLTHPLDLIKVLLQTYQHEKVSIITLTKKILKEQGIIAFYNGVSASLLRQLTYATTRFGIYEVLKQNYQKQIHDSFVAKILAASIGGAVGGVVGTPADLVTVRMQNDTKLPKEKRRNYKHAIDGVIRVYKEEGLKRLFGGATAASSKAVLVTVGQMSTYDETKIALLKSGHFHDNVQMHFTASLISTTITMCMAQPVDVTKTRLMNAKEGEYKNVWDCLRSIAHSGLTGFYKGLVPSSLRVFPNTILLFIFYEQLIKHFGYIPEEV